MSTLPTGAVMPPYTHGPVTRVARYPQDTTTTPTQLSSVQHDRASSDFAHKWLWLDYFISSPLPVQFLFHNLNPIHDASLHNNRMSAYRQNGSASCQIESVTMTASMPLCVSFTRTGTLDAASLQTMQMLDLFNTSHTHLYTSTTHEEQTFPIGITTQVSTSEVLRDAAIDIIVAPLYTQPAAATFFGTLVFSISSFSRV